MPARNDGIQLPPISGYRISNTFTVLVQDDDPLKLGALASRVLDTALYEAGFRRTDAAGVENAPGTITVAEAPGNDFGDEFNIEVPLYLLARPSGGEAHT